MSRYIDVEPFLKMLEISNIKTDGSQYASGYNDAVRSIYRALKGMPTADVVEVEHGSFVWIADDSPMCNICGEVFDTNDNADAGLWKYCPNCGAKMDGGREQ